MDGRGNIGLAYSVSSTSMFPSLRFTGRTAGDALGQMTVNETSIVAGTAASSGERWGDYASLSVDPSDDCTFWFTGEYQTSDGWATRIASFQIQCQAIAPTADFTASTTALCLDEATTITFSDASTGSPTSWAWTFESGNPATSTAQNPTVTYSTPGTYDVQLVVTNAEGSNTSTKTDFITVTSAPCGPVCQTSASTDIPKTIPEEEGTVTSTLNISTNTVITDVNVLGIKGTHGFFDELSASLSSPSGTTVDLFNQECFGGPESFNFSLDDAATTNLDPACNYDQGGVFKPLSALSAFNGQNAMGTWTLTITDHFFFDGGALTDWSLEICGSNPTTGCEETVTVANTINSGTTKAAQTINATGTVANGASVLFQAGTTVNLNSPFTVPSGAIFTAEIANCTSTLTNPATAKETVALVNPITETPISLAPLEIHIAPNPLQYSTTISYKVPAPLSESVSLQIINALGQPIAQLEEGIVKTPGIYRVDYQFEHQQNGIYFAVLTIGQQRITKRMLLLK